MKKLHGIRVVAHGQKRHFRNRQKHAWRNSPTYKLLDLLTVMWKDYPEHNLYWRF